MRIGRTYRFEAAHHLPLVPDGHKCKNMHGHNYRIEVVVRGESDERGFIKDFAEMDAEILPLIRRLDHCVLNDVAGLKNPTAENIASWFFVSIENCEKVRVYENDDCWAECDERNATIERCAQAAKEACDKWEIPSHRVVAAIRALKD